MICDSRIDEICTLDKKDGAAEFYRALTNPITLMALARAKDEDKVAQILKLQYTEVWKRL